MRWQDIAFDPKSRTLRQFAASWLVFFGAFAAWQQFGKGHSGAAAMVGGLAVLIGVPGLIHPPLVRWVYVATSVVSFPIGWVVSHVLLALIFYLLITPLGILRRVFGRDALQLRRPTGETYWMEKKPVTDPARYLKQF